MPQNNLLENVANNLRTLRGRRGLSREQLAATAEVDPQMIKRIENGRANPALVVLSRLASALMISVSLMVGDVAGEPARLDSTETSSTLESETVGETIATLRRQRHLSRRAVASMANLRSVTLSRYESATADARLLSIDPLARALGLTSIDLIRAVEIRQREIDRSRQGWSTPAAGVQCRIVSCGEASQLWEWRIAPGVTFSDAPGITAPEEIATAIRGDVRVELGGKTHRLRRGGSLAIPAGTSVTIANAGASTARLLRFRVAK
ncbi:MAG TPA: helix-turn-helix domain-containing protein [Thermoanaerobaculia bacterium]|nr:helix-turn-helix domain-containing protein [Thermoanaerobaculia bacterium]